MYFLLELHEPLNRAARICVPELQAPLYYKKGFPEKRDVKKVYYSTPLGP